VPVSKARKSEQIDAYVDLLKASNGFAIVQTQGLSVNRVEALRLKIRNAGGKYIVGKNTIVTKALEREGWVVPANLLQGPTGVVFGNDNFPGVAKVLLDWVEAEKLESAQFNVIGGVMGGDVLNGEGVKAVSNLPTLPELQAQIIGLIVMPATHLASLLAAATSSVLNVVQAWEDDQNKGAA
jgi:large subunit ribosomal protein L10